ncbi:MAG: NAD(P)H-hydrate dehydratase [Proteobacteria bacterium]|nr:NAD(P)H-hydrate dehydratase [Pseudomonadota bacterium]
MARPEPLLTAEQMAELDRRTIQDLGVPGLVLMESAAWACCEVLLERYRDRLEGGVCIVCGPGNNGGDGLAMARRLHLLGVSVEVTLLTRVSRLQGDAATQAELAQNVGVTLREAPGSEPLGFAIRKWPVCGVLVDALLGTGLTREVEGVFAEAIDAMARARAAGVPVLAVDIPSGVSGTTGQVHATAVAADVTVTFAALKLGHVLYPGRGRCGDLVKADIGIPAERWLDLIPDIAHLLDASALADALPPGAPDGHKGTFGHLLVAAGGPGKTGAARLCAEAALKAGAGLVTLALPVGLDVPGLAPEIMVERYADADALLALAHARSAVAVGPGLGTEASTVELVGRLYAELTVPAVFDADALNGLAETESWPDPSAARVLTPHPGEMARLMTSPWSELSARRVAAARQLASEAAATVVLKGAGTIVAQPGGAVFVNPTGNPGMATAGSGDVLTGVVGGLLARGLPSSTAAGAAVWWHGRAGDRAAAALGEPTLTAGDLITWLGEAWADARGGVGAFFESRP